MALPLRAALRSAGRFIVRNPTTMLSMARHALGMRIAVPLDALRWFIANTPPSKKAPQDVTITPRPPAIGLGATIDLMGTTVRAGASIRVDQIEVSDTAFKVTLRLSDVTMKVLGESFTPVAGLIKSGALDLSKPGNLAKFMPKRPPVLVEAHDDILVLDLMQNEKFATNDRVQRFSSDATVVRMRRIAMRYRPVKEQPPNLQLVGIERLDEGDAYVLQGRIDSVTTQRSYFDVVTGLLRREITTTETLLVPLEEQVDYDDYRDVGGMQMPFRVRISDGAPYSTTTRTILEIRRNVPVDDALFRPPAPR